MQVESTKKSPGTFSATCFLMFAMIASSLRSSYRMLGGAAREAWRSLFRFQLLECDVLVEHLRLCSTVDLQADDAAALDPVVLLGVVHRQRAIEPEADARPLAADDILVPVVMLDQFGD